MDLEKLILTTPDKETTQKEIEAIVENAKIKYNVAEISVVHYLGEFYTGDSLFLVAVLGNHRGETLDALKEVIETVKYEVEFKKEEIFIPTVGEHNIYNAMAAILVGRELNISLDDIKCGLRNFKATKMRLDIIKNEL